MPQPSHANRLHPCGEFGIWNFHSMIWKILFFLSAILLAVGWYLFWPKPLSKGKSAAPRATRVLLKSFHSAQKFFHSNNGRFGTFKELKFDAFTDLDDRYHHKFLDLVKPDEKYYAIYALPIYSSDDYFYKRMYMTNQGTIRFDLNGSLISNINDLEEVVEEINNFPEEIEARNIYYKRQSPLPPEPSEVKDLFPKLSSF